MTQPVDTKELRLAGNDYMMTQPYATKYPQLVLDAADELDALRKERDELEKILKIKAIALDYVFNGVSWLSSCPSSMSHFSFEEMLDKIHEFVTSPLIASEVEKHIGYSETNMLISIDDYVEEQKKSDDQITALCARVTELEAQLSKSEEWGKEMKRQANEQANLANTWMNRRLAMQDVLARICYERDELRSGNDNLQLQVTDLQKQLAEAKGALIAHDRMQNEQLAKHRDIEILALPDHIVASSDIVDDLCDHFYGLLCKQQQQLAEARGIVNILNSESLLETLADIEHERWSGWMKYQFENDTVGNREWWKRLSETPYSELSEHSKESDRKEVRKTLSAITAAIEAAKQNEENNNGNG